MTRLRIALFQVYFDSMVQILTQLAKHALNCPLHISPCQPYLIFGCTQRRAYTCIHFDNNFYSFHTHHACAPSIIHACALIFLHAFQSETHLKMFIIQIKHFGSRFNTNFQLSSCIQLQLPFFLIKLLNLHQLVYLFNTLNLSHSFLIFSFFFLYCFLVLTQYQ